MTDTKPPAPILSGSIVYQDESFMVLNKPSGMTVNRADTTRGEETLQDWVENLGVTRVGDPRRSPGMNMKPSDGGDERQDPEEKAYDVVEEFKNRGGIVHRLDKETSGVILVAKDPGTFGALKKQFMERTVQKTYIALAHGKIEPIEGEINVPVGRLEFNRKRFGVVAGGREAVTRYRVISNFKYQISNKKIEELSLVELYPQTGRTHQIRVHLKHIGHPIFGDHLYAGRKVSRDDRMLLPRFFLHAAKISFIHPKTGERVEFSAELPQELKTFMERFLAR